MCSTEKPSPTLATARVFRANLSTGALRVLAEARSMGDVSQEFVGAGFRASLFEHGDGVARPCRCRLCLGQSDQDPRSFENLPHEGLHRKRVLERSGLLLLLGTVGRLQARPRP